MNKAQRDRRSEIISEFVEARGLLEDAKATIKRCRAEIKELCEPGQHGDVTVYKVKRTQVQSYTRRGYTAVRGRTLR